MRWIFADIHILHFFSATACIFPFAIKSTVASPKINPSNVVSDYLYPIPATKQPSLVYSRSHPVVPFLLSRHPRLPKKIPKTCDASAKALERFVVGVAYFRQCSCTPDRSVFRACFSLSCESYFISKDFIKRHTNILVLRYVYTPVYKTLSVK